VSERMQPPKWADKFLSWFCSEKILETLQGDLYELYEKRKAARGKFIADLCYVRDVVDVCRPFAIRRSPSLPLSQMAMFQTYFRIGWRNVLKNRGYSLINVGGLTIGITVVIFIAQWVNDELSFNKYHKNYNDIAQVWSMETDTQTREIGGGQAIQYPVASTLRNNYPQYFKHVLMAWWIGGHTLSSDDDKFTKGGAFIEGGALEMLSLKMLKGSYQSMDEPRSIVLSKTAAESIFGDEDPMNKTLTIDGRMEAQVTGIYEDIPRNNRFSEVEFFVPWSLWLSVNRWAQGREGDWDNRPFNIYVQLQPGVTMEDANAGIKDLYAKNIPADFYKTVEKYKPFAQLVPMSTWHLYSEFKDGKPSGGRITYVWLFGVVGIFVLLLACINFINLSTARSEKRAHEVGVRKTVGSGRWQLISQFLSESLMVVCVAFALSLVLVTLVQPWFNELSDKNIGLPFVHSVFWGLAFAFIIMTSLIAGVYPAFYLSSFEPVKVLKGVFLVGRFAALPRKILVVVQFTVSSVLIAGTFIVYQQIQFARNRPIGYSRENLISLNMNDAGYKGKIEVLKNELLSSGVVTDVTTSSGPLTATTNVTNGYNWEGKDPNLDASFAICNVERDFGRTVDWKFVGGRDFSKELSSDSTDAIIINEAAVKYMGIKDPVGKEFIDVDELGVKKRSWTIIGVVKDLVTDSPYDPVRPTLYFHDENASRQLHMRINPTMSASLALEKMESILNKVVPSALFEYKFVDQQYAQKFSQEERIGKLSGIFAAFAILISCLGLFGLASFVAERRTKEIGIRKVVGASVFSLWKMLSKDFLFLVIISCFIAIPIAYYFLAEWLEKFQYRVEISWWIFVATSLGALAITLLTVSYQAVKAALMNPVKSLRTE
jgi:putative ABC transport system permease protein